MPGLWAVGDPSGRRGCAGGPCTGLLSAGADPRREQRVSPGSSAFPGRRPLCPSALSGCASLGRQSPDPQRCPCSPAGHATRTDPAASARCFQRVQTLLETGRHGPPPCRSVPLRAAGTSSGESHASPPLSAFPRQKCWRISVCYPIRFFSLARKSPALTESPVHPQRSRPAPELRWCVLVQGLHFQD